MQLQDKIGKSSWMFQESIKDSVVTNVMTAIKTGQIKVEPNQLPTILAVLNSSTEAGYHKAFTVFMRQVTQAIADEKKTLNTQK